MSYILNALRKAEKERRQHLEQSLSEQLQDSNARNPRNLLPWLIALLAVNAGILGYVMMTRDKPQKQEERPVQPQAIAPARTQATVPTTAGKKPENSSEQTPSIAGIIDKQKQAVKMPERQNDAAVRPAQSSQPAVVAKHAPDIAAKGDIAMERVIKPAVAPATDAKEISGSMSKTENAQEIVVLRSDLTTVKENKTTLPWLQELPHDFRRKVPELDINVYVYSDLPKNRFIMIAMKKYRAGQEISPSMVLKEIQSDGIVVEFQGRRFKIKRV